MVFGGGFAEEDSGLVLVVVMFDGRGESTKGTGEKVSIGGAAGPAGGRENVVVVVGVGVDGASCGCALSTAVASAPAAAVVAASTAAAASVPP